MRVCVDELRSLAIIELLQAHLDHCRSSSPPESVHALDLDKLRASDVTFWSIWNEGSLLGCGALKQLDPLHGEIKSMHTAAQYKGSGVGAAMLAHIVAEARSRHYQRLSLETGSNERLRPRAGCIRALVS